MENTNNNNTQQNPVSPITLGTDLAPSPVGNAAMSTSPIIPPVGNAVTPTSPVAPPVGNAAIPASPVTPPVGNLTMSASPVTPPVGNAVTPTNPVAPPVGNAAIPAKQPNQAAPVQSLPKKKKKKKKKHGCLISLLVFLLLILAIFGIFKLKGYIQKKKYDKLVSETVTLMPMEEIELTEEELLMDFNNDGISNKEALDLGLNPMAADGDSDGDGLTDSDELNIYHTDPLVYSTTGDIYGDGYKVAHNYELTKNYGNTGVIETENEAVTLMAVKAEDQLACYMEYTGSIPANYALGMQPFRIYSFQGEVEIQIDNAQQFDVISYDNLKKEITELKVKRTDSTLTVSIENDNPLLVVYKSKYLKGLDDYARSNLDYLNTVDTEYLVVYMPIFNVLFRTPVYVFQVTDSNFEDPHNFTLQSNLEKRACDVFTVEAAYIDPLGADMLDQVFGKLQNDVDSYGTDVKETRKYLFGYRHFHSYHDLEHFLFSSDATGNEGETTGDTPLEEKRYPFEEKYDYTGGVRCADSGFSVSHNAFRFRNLFVPKSSGVCMGIAHLTTCIYNNSPVPATVPDVYDLTDSAFDEMWDKELYSYLPQSEALQNYCDEIFGNEAVLNTSPKIITQKDLVPVYGEEGSKKFMISYVDGPDAELIDALYYYTILINNKVHVHRLGWVWNNLIQMPSYIEGDTIDRLVEQFNQGKIVTVMLLDVESKHAVNAYKIVEDPNDPNILYLKIYDNNIPGDYFWKKEDQIVKRDVTITLKRVFQITFHGKEERFVFEYDPLDSTSYYYGNFNGETDYLLFFDENCDIL